MRQLHRLQSSLKLLIRGNQMLGASKSPATTTWQHQHHMLASARPAVAARTAAAQLYGPCVTYSSSPWLSTHHICRGFSRSAVAVEAVSRRTASPPQAYGAEQIQVCMCCTCKPGLPQQQAGLQQQHLQGYACLLPSMLQSVVAQQPHAISEG
jgi:hypothetical protein